MKYIQPLTYYKRFVTREVNVGGICIGGENPIRVQTMTNTDTLDTKKTVEQIIRIHNAGADLVRLTTQGIKEAENLNSIKKLLSQKSINIPLIADVHFNPKVAEIAARIVSKVRINPGNYSDLSKSAKKLDFTEKQFAEEKEKIRNNLLPLLKICKSYGTAIRIGINHGSLSWRIVNRYGNTPEGMVASALEFLEICNEESFNNVVVSMKASNPLTMVHANRLLVQKMYETKLNYPIHIGVTEAGLGDDGRIKSTVGIGMLLCEGIGDTIRVSLTEAPENEIPVAKKIIEETKNVISSNIAKCDNNIKYNVFSFSKRISTGVGKIGGDCKPVLIFTDFISKNILKQDINLKSEIFENELHIIEINNIISFRKKITELEKLNENKPIVLKINVKNINQNNILYNISIFAGGLLVDGRLNGIWITGTSNENFEYIIQLVYSVMQASRARVTKTEYISCPSCGRTLFDIEKAAKEVKEATKQYAGLKIAVMGCVVNGPGEMADADYGYVGSGNNKVNIYKGNQLVLRNIPETEAVSELIKLINNR